MNSLQTVVSRIIFDYTGFKTTLYQDVMGGNYAALQVNLGSDKDIGPHGIDQVIQEKIVKVFKDSIAFNEIMLMHTEEKRALQEKIDELELKVQDLIPYKHHALVQKEINEKAQS